MRSISHCLKLRATAPAFECFRRIVLRSMRHPPAPATRIDTSATLKECTGSQMDLHLRICRDAWGTWSVYGLSPLPASHLPSLSASIDYAREECAASPATIELMIDGFYVVAYQELGWPRQLVAPEGEPGVTAPPTQTGFRNWLKNGQS
jgi:hypothetical protein